MSIHELSRDWGLPTEVDAFAQPCQGALSGTIMGLALTDDVLKLSGHQRANGCPVFSRKYFGFAYQGRIESESNIRLHIARKLAQQH